MSINGSNRESILAVFLKDFYKDWSNLLGFHVENLRLEQRHAGNNIDLIGVDSKRRVGVYFELQVTKANKIYLSRIKEMMIKYPEGVIVWIADSFTDELLADLEIWMKQTNRQYIDFYAVTISGFAQKGLEEFNGIYKLDVYDKLSCFKKIDNILSVYYGNKNINPFHCGGMYTDPIPLDFSRTEDVKKALLMKLREKVPYYLNLHFEKKANQNDHIMTIGGGRSGVYYRCSVKDVRKRSFVELFFCESKVDWYEAFKFRKEEIQEKVHPSIFFSKRRIGVYLKLDDDYEVIFDKLSDIFKKMIDYFSKFTYGNFPIMNDVERIPVHTKVVHTSIRLVEQPFQTEDSYRIQVEELSELLMYTL